MITIIDYGMGNLKSVYNALKKVNFDCQISSEVTDIEMADKLILQGWVPLRMQWIICKILI